MVLQGLERMCCLFQRTESSADVVFILQILCICLEQLCRLLKQAWRILFQYPVPCCIYRDPIASSTEEQDCAAGAQGA